jgi:hypothetical protein
MLSLPREIIPRLIADLDCAVELLATCHQLRASIPSDLFVMSGGVDAIVTSGYYECNILHTYFNIIGFVAPYYHKCTIMVGNWMISPRRAAYLRVFTAANVAYYRLAAEFAANVDGIMPIWEDRHIPTQSAAVLSYPLVDGRSPNVLTGSREMLQTIARILAKESRLFVRAASVDEIFDVVTA